MKAPKISLPRKSVVKFVILALAVASTSSACLTTRSQLKKTGIDGDDPVGATQPAEVSDVEPKGNYALDEIKGEITRLNGRIEDLERARGTEADQALSEKKKQEVFDQMERRITELETAQVELIEQLKAVQGAAQSRTAANSASQVDEARTKISQGDRESAITLLDQYLSTPKASRSEEATFLRGEAHYDLKQYRKAIADYGQFTEKFTKSKLMPKVLYKLGLSFRAINSKEDATVFLQELVDKHPSSAEAKKARALLGRQR